MRKTNLNELQTGPPLLVYVVTESIQQWGQDIKSMRNEEQIKAPLQ